MITHPHVDKWLPILMIYPWKGNHCNQKAWGQASNPQAKHQETRSGNGFLGSTYLSIQSSWSVFKRPLSDKLVPIVWLRTLYVYIYIYTYIYKSTYIYIYISISTHTSFNHKYILIHFPYRMPAFMPPSLGKSFPFSPHFQVFLWICKSYLKWLITTCPTILWILSSALSLAKPTSIAHWSSIVKPSILLVKSLLFLTLEVATVTSITQRQFLFVSL